MTEKPTPPMDGECCESECSPCVWDTYYEAMRVWRAAEAQRKAEQDGNGDDDSTSPTQD